jgi:serine/threonine protein kinase
VQTLRCARCSSDLPASAVYCPKCGAPTDSQATLGADAATIDNPAPFSRSRSLLDSPAIDQARFVPGQILADRYRIVALLGKGGMGEVYRADDLRLSQTVAMKFLPASLSQDGAALARFHREVRVARQVSHANVCRVFDIGETAGLPFLTMEYVDGEDLASLLKRIGRLPQDKAIDISRQLCAGLAAAHEAGVLHRDLKPANVMLDKRGKVRITDFGLAGLSAAAGDELRSGTPAYMAPEQLSGQPATEQSDIYALGLVLYEVFTGKRVFDAATLAELIRQHESTTPTNPSQLVRDLDPLVERVILRCLENDPQGRPRSALQVAAALPGGDPLAEALAAGETPSPEMVAAAGGEGVLRPKLAWSLLLSSLMVLAAIVALAPYSTDLGIAPPYKNASALEVKAQDIVEKAGYTDAPADRASWFDRNYEFMLYQARQFSTPLARKNLPHAELGVFTFYYRQSPVAMAPTTDWRVLPLDPPYEVSGMVTVVLDDSGKLVGFVAVPPQVEQPGATSDPNWTQMIADSGISAATLQSADSTWLPPVPFDRRFGWRGFYPEDPKTEVKISAASYRGKPVYFHVIGPWTRPWRMRAEARTPARVVRDSTLVLGGFFTLLLGGIFARRNLRLGRGDRRGALRISAFVFCMALAAALLIAHDVPDLAGEWTMFARAVGAALFVAAFLWLLYLALEPFVRRQWPELLISWSRLLGGNFRDPLIGRDLLVGTLCGSFAALCIHVANSLPGWFNFPGQTTIAPNPFSLGSAPQVLGYLIALVLFAMFPALATTFCLFLMKTLLRKSWLSVVVTGILLLLTNLGGENFALEFLPVLLMTSIMMFVLVRFGILAFTFMIFTEQLLVSCPITFDLSKWYAPHSVFMFGVLLAMLFYGVRLATGNKPLLVE